ncbi:MAG: FAD-binding protein, partial [Armatimonadetes bacterium]|nr:FAD-binding protein [Armatimonadota bacterium]
WHLGEEKIMKKIPFVRELARNYAGVDPVHEPISVRPVVHYMMGGIDTNREAATTLPGLYAAGECACVSINGANRLGSNSLTELLVFGAMAGRQAARFAQEHPISHRESLIRQAEEEQRRMSQQYLNKDGGAESISGLKAELNTTMEEGAGIYRTEASMRQTCEAVQKLQERYQNIKMDDRTHSFNTELVAALELGSLLDVAESVAQSALLRKESRGAHQRTDYPKRDDEHFLQHSLAYRTGGEPRIEYRPVVITNWAPAERVYGR